MPRHTIENNARQLTKCRVLLEYVLREIDKRLILEEEHKDNGVTSLKMSESSSFTNMSSRQTLQLFNVPPTAELLIMARVSQYVHNRKRQIAFSADFQGRIDVCSSISVIDETLNLQPLNSLMQHSMPIQQSSSSRFPMEVCNDAAGNNDDCAENLDDDIRLDESILHHELPD